MIEKLADHDLNEKVKTLASQERLLTQEVLEYIAEVDSRLLFLRMGYSSLFTYLTQETRYSEGAAQRRIDAARLLCKIPELSTLLTSGAINLSQISKVQKACRQAKKESGQRVNVTDQKSVLVKVENKNSRETDLILAREFKLKIKDQEKNNIQRDESVRVEITFSKEEWVLIQKTRALLSNKTGGQLKDTILEMVRREIKSSSVKVKKTKIETLEMKSSKNDKASLIAPNSTSAATVAVKSVTPRLRREILNRDKACQFRNVESGKLCGSAFFLEVDHILPRYKDGTNEIRNLRALCKNHNIFRYRAGT